MKKIMKWFLSLILCLCLCFPTFASDDYLNHDVVYNQYNDSGGISWRFGVSFDSEAYVLLQSRYLDFADSYFRIMISDAPFTVTTYNADGTFFRSSDAQSGSEYGHPELYFHNSVGVLNYTDTYNFVDSPSGLLNATQQISWFLESYANGSFPVTPDGQEYAYDSSIPAPQNLKLDFIKTNVGILGLSKRTDLQLSWSNVLVDDYGVQISASMTVEVFDTEGTSNNVKKKLTYKLVGLSQADSGGADAGYPASKGKFTVTEDELLSIAQKELGDTVKVEKVYVDAFRVQFYRIDSGVVNVGPVGVLNLNYSFLGKYMGSTSTVEYPSNSSDVGEDGGIMPDDSGKWSGDGTGSEYDADGNYVGSPDGSSGNASWSDTFKALLDGFVNIPTVLAQFFNSLKDMMSGIGEFPAFLAQVVSWLPPSIISIIGVGLVLVVVLRIFGR